MTGKIDRVEVITSVQRRRRWPAEEKARIVQETYMPGMSVSLVARQHGIQPSQLFNWRRLYAAGALSAVGFCEAVVPASDYRALQHQVRELQRLLGKKTLETEILRGSVGPRTAKKTAVALTLLRSGRYAMKTVADTAQRRTLEPGCAGSPDTTIRQRRGRRPQPDIALLAEIKELIAELPTYGYRRVHALLRRRRKQTGEAAVNVKRVHRVMRAHGLLLQRHPGADTERRHDGRVAVDQSDTRWCSDGFEIGCDNSLPPRKRRVRVAFTLDCCDREAISWIAITGGIDGSDIRDLMVESMERRFGLVDQLPEPITTRVPRFGEEWRDRQRGRRNAPTASQRPVHGRGRVTPQRRAQRGDAKRLA